MAWHDVRKMLRQCPSGVSLHNLRALMESLQGPRPRERIERRPDGVTVHYCESATHEEPEEFNRRVHGNRPRMFRGAA